MKWSKTGWHSFKINHAILFEWQSLLKHGIVQVHHHPYLSNLTLWNFFELPQQKINPIYIYSPPLFFHTFNEAFPSDEPDPRDWTCDLHPITFQLNVVAVQPICQPNVPHSMDFRHRRPTKCHYWHHSIELLRLTRAREHYHWTVEVHWGDHLTR